MDCSKETIKFLKEYEVSTATFALVPHTFADGFSITKVIEEKEEFYVLKKPFQVIEASCRLRGHSFHSRRDLTKFATNITHKQPIVICEIENIFMFPTMSYSHVECSWVNHKAIRKMYPYVNNQTCVDLQNGKSILFPISFASFENQLLRTAHLRHAIQSRSHQQEQRPFILAPLSVIYEKNLTHSKIIANIKKYEK